MSNWKIYLGVFVVLHLFHHNFNKKKNSKEEEIKKISNLKAEKIILDFFYKTKLEDPYITLDKIILKFENADEFDSLENFAETKHRTADNYRQTYIKYYKKFFKDV